MPGRAVNRTRGRPAPGRGPPLPAPARRPPHVHHHVSPEYLQDYLNEHAFRYSHRNDVKPMFLSFLDQVGTEC